MDDKRIHLLKNEKISKAINAMAAPAIIGMLVMAIYNVADSMFVSWIGGEHIGATQVVFPIMLIASSIGLSFGIGGGSYISRLLGKNNKDEANNVASVSFFTGLIIGIIITILNLLFLEPILALFGADDSVMTLAKEYGRYIVIGYAFTILNMVLNNSLRSEGSAKYSMIGMGLGSILNIILDPIFIFVFDWGIAGAAIATTLSQVVTFIILFSTYIRGKSILKISIAHFKPSIQIYKEILVVGLPTFFRQVLVSIAIGIMNSAAISYGGTDLLAATSIIIRVTMVPNYVIFGFGQGFQPVAGFNFGAGNKDRVLESFKYSLIISSAILITSALLFIVFGDVVFKIYRSSAEVTAYGVRGIRFFAIGMLFFGATNTITVFYQALGRGVEAMLLSVSRQGIIFIPALLLLPKYLDTDGVLFAQPMSDLITFVLAVCLIIPFLKRDKVSELIARQERL